MSSSDDLKSLMRDMGATPIVSESLIRKVLETLSGDVTAPKREQIVRNLIEFAIRMYLVQSSSFNSTRATQLLDSLGADSLGHTRAD